MEKSRLDKLADKLRINEWDVRVFNKPPEATQFLFTLCKEKVVGIGDSQTLISLGLIEKLQQNGETIFACSLDKSRENKLKSLNSEIFLLSANAIAEDTGEMVNVDSSCNRVAASLYGPEEVVFVITENKIVSNLEEAIHRARNVAAPMNAKIHNYNTPCVTTGRCEDCRTKDRICRATVIYHKRPKPMKGTVVLIEDSLGF